MIILCILKVKEDWVQFTHIEHDILIHRYEILLITLEFPFELIVLEDVDRFKCHLTLHFVEALGFSWKLLFVIELHLPNEGQVLTTDLNQILHFSIRIINTGATIRYVYQNVFGSLVILTLNGTTDTQHEVCSLFLYLFNITLTWLLNTILSSLVILAI